MKKLLTKAKLGGQRLVLLLITALVLALMPIRVLFRRQPFRNYVFVVAFQWMKVSTNLLKACGAQCIINTSTKPE